MARAVCRHAGGEGKPSEGGEWEWDALLAAWVEEGLSEERFWKQTPRRFAVVLAASQRGNLERTIVLAHQIEVMARSKKLKPLEDYLKPVRKRQRRPPNNNALIAAHLDRIAQRKSDDGSD